MTGADRSLRLIPGATSTASSADPEAAGAALGHDRDARWAIQWVLTRLGYDTKGVDGAFGQNSRRAISRFQANVGLRETGFVDAATRTVLVKNGDLLFGVLQAERMVWRAIGPGAREDALREFLARFPDGRHA